ncbi:hypothetical protein HHK36_021212 [Tetracentron sinense]|uniref:Ubiquitin receptor RAD23 n=1 Tax=Tetracentron sinense TaxID=13715 RepID=A0A835D7L6_TETSI|nr:hypothetical protein HHK36_021212 [Tetracentron sinense]
MRLFVFSEFELSRNHSILVLVVELDPSISLETTSRCGSYSIHTRPPLKWGTSPIAHASGARQAKSSTFKTNSGAPCRKKSVYNAPSHIHGAPLTDCSISVLGISLLKLRKCMYNSWDLFDQPEQDMPHAVSVTPAEQEAIERLEAMGFDRALVIEAFLACDRNEELAVNYLLENAGDYED